MNANDRGRPLQGLRVMMQEDLRGVLQIELDSFEHPWSERDFLEHFEDPRSVALVVERDGLLVGYEVYGTGIPWIQLYSCVVRREYRRLGFGSRMVAHLASLATAQEPGGILVKVPERNVGAQLFFRQCGFRAMKVLRNCLLDDQDVFVMKYSVPEWVSPGFDLVIPEDELIPIWAVKHG